MENDTSYQASRRRVLLAGSASVLGAATLAACGSDDTSDAVGPVATTGGSEAVPAGANPTPLIALSKVPEGGAVAVSAAGLNLIVARPAGGGDPVAMTSVCPHQGCKVAPQGTELICPCHQSTFELTGKKVSGPAPTGLPTYPVEVKDGTVVLTSTTQGAPAA